MGFDVRRFVEEVDEELMCPICSYVLENPVQAPRCEHAFCKSCIEEWLTHQSTCPVDREPVVASHLTLVPRILRNLLARLMIHCDNQQFGCTVCVRLDALPQHLKDCEFNPSRPVPCDQGCGLVLPKDRISEHNCVRDLRELVESQGKQLDDFRVQLRENQLALQIQARDIAVLKEAVRTLSSGQSVNIPNLLTENEEDEEEIRRWAASLPLARVNRWGGMISTPDAVLQSVIRRSLHESGSPLRLLNDLMERAHERNWPAGLQTLEIRQMNRIHYDRMICRRVPGKQAVVVLACENRDLPPHLLDEPGIMIIFAHGVE